MALFNDEYNDDSKTIRLGAHDDYCYICARSIKGKNIPEVNEQVDKLKGKLEGKLIMKFQRSGIYTCICGDCIKKAHDKIFKEEDEKDAKS